MTQEIIETKAAPNPIGPYSQAIRANGFVFVSGQIAIDPATGNLVEGDIVHQTRRVLENLAAILKAGGSGLDKVIKTTVFLSNLDDFAHFNRIYADFLGVARPARATVQVSKLPKDALIEVDAVALA